MTRKDPKDVIGIITGNGKQNKHMQHMNISTSSYCRWCKVKYETSEYIPLEWHELNKQEVLHLGKYSKLRQISKNTFFSRFLRSLNLL